MNTQQNKFVIAEIGEEAFGVPVEEVIAIEKPQPITKIPNTAEYVRGVTHIRGKVTPILDLRTYLFKEHTKVSNEHRIVLIQLEENRIGLIVDDANDIVDIPADTIQTVNVDTDENVASMNVAKLEERLILLLDIQYMLTEMDAELFQKLKEAV